MKLPPTSSANTATRNDAQAKKRQTERESLRLWSNTIPFQPRMSQTPDHYAVTDIGVLRFQTIMHLRLWKKGSDSRPLCSYGYWNVQTPDQSCTNGYGRAWTLHHYAVNRS